MALPDHLPNVSDLTLSLIIPAYNEASRICGTLDACNQYFNAEGLTAEIIVVDDGSVDGTAEIVAREHPEARVIWYAQNRGKGHAVKAGMAEARGAYRLIYDADGSTPIGELAKVWPLTDAGADIVIGSRALPESDIAIRQPWYRQNMGRIYNLLLKGLRLTRFPDTQCGFKVVNAASAEAIMPLITRDGFGMDCEMLAIAERKGFRVAQVPVRWLNSKDSRVRVIRDSLEMIREVVVVRWNLTTGKYDRLADSASDQG